MKKKNELDILFNWNDEIVKDLAQRPVLNERERKKMLEMSKKKLEGIKLVYLGDGRYNMGDSYMVGSAKMGLDFYMIAPKSLLHNKDLI